MQHNCNYPPPEPHTSQTTWSWTDFQQTMLTLREERLRSVARQYANCWDHLHADLATTTSFSLHPERHDECHMEGMQGCDFSQSCSLRREGHHQLQSSDRDARLHRFGSQLLQHQQRAACSKVIAGFRDGNKNWENGVGPIARKLVKTGHTFGQRRRRTKLHCDHIDTGSDVCALTDEKCEMQVEIHNVSSVVSCLVSPSLVLHRRVFPLPLTWPVAMYC